METLRKENLYAKFSKCALWLREVHFLGRVINANGILVDPSKVEIVKKWFPPKTLAKGKDQGNAFCVLKEKLTRASILMLTNGTDDFVVYSDASRLGLGFVLMQRDKVIAYVTRQLA
ncbi:hypothetical protein L1987_43927 [Smallanthus sonchifolius]|uniref:Uncharacterized protein n=1 Tax=Smallanthus sonchifolius TaxID=185202 RepID=A0ACB9GNP1_9ASTR|nr:hypothetical protein L1987_43927 [Smallanthus sonchifolius]